MNIKEAKTAFKIADALLDKKHKKNYIRFIFLPEIVDEKGQKLDKTVLADRKGRVYLIVVGGIIKKIGGSMDGGGIKATLSFYQGAMQGRPGISRYGTHILIKEALDKNCKVEIYMISSKEIEATVKGLFSEGSEMKKVTVFKEMEDKCKQDYKEKEGTYPEWNFQERGESWPSRIQKKHNEYLSTRIGKKAKLNFSEGKK